MKKVLGSLAVVGSTLLAAGQSFALDFTQDPVTLNTTDVDTVMVAIIAGLATLWGFRKIIKTMNRS